jgi:hypothetical protein
LCPSPLVVLLWIKALTCPSANFYRNSRSFAREFAETLANLLAAWKQPKPAPTNPKPIPVTKQVASIKSWETAIEKNVASYEKADLQTLLDQLQAFVLFVKEKMRPTA